MYNKSHFYIPFVGLLVFIPAVFLLMSAGIAMLTLGWGLTMLSAVAFWYEWTQLINAYSVDIIADSKEDIRNFAIGTMAGVFFGFVVYVIILKLF